VVMRFEIAVHKQCSSVRADLAQHPALDEKPKIVVDRGQRNGWNATPDCGVNVFRRIVPVSRDDGLIDHLALVRDRQTMLRCQLTELYMGEAHNYRIRIIVKRSGVVSTEMFSVECPREHSFFKISTHANSIGISRGERSTTVHESELSDLNTKGCGKWKNTIDAESHKRPKAAAVKVNFRYHYV
jgi:hypothetical protein